MNCKQGDLAYIVMPSFPKWDHKFVTCVFFSHDDSYFGPTWVIKPAGWTPSPEDVALSSDGTCLYPDQYLRPIRPQSDDATDEMVKIADKPPEVTA